MRVLDQLDVVAERVGHPAEPLPAYLNTRAQRRPEYALVRAALALRAGQPLAVESWLRHAGAKAALDGPVPLTAAGLRGELLAHLEEWSRSPEYPAGEAGPRWLLLGELRREGDRPEAALVALESGLQAGGDPAEAEQAVQRLLAGRTPTVRALAEAARRLNGSAHARICYGLVRAALADPGVEATELADELLPALVRDPGLCADAWRTWAGVPLRRRRPTEVIVRLRRGQREAGLTPAQLGADLANLPAEAFAEEDLVWAIEVDAARGAFAAGLDRYDRLHDADLRIRALDALATVPSAPVEQARRLFRYQVRHALDTDSVDRLGRAVAEQFELHRSVNDDAILSEVIEGLEGLADRQHGAAVRTGADYLIGQNQHRISAAVLDRLYKAGGLPGEEDLALVERTCAGLSDYTARRGVRFVLADRLPASRPALVARVYCTHYEREFLADAAPAAELDEVRRRLDLLAATPVGQSVGPAHLVAGRIALRQGDVAGGLRRLALASANGEPAEARADLARLFDDPECPVRAEAGFELTRTRHRLGKSVTRQLHCLFDVLEAGPPERWSAWRAEANQLLDSLNLDSSERGTSADAVTPAALRLWAHDLGQPDEPAWPGELVRSAEAVVDVLSRTDAPGWRAWLRDRLVPRRDRAPVPLLISFLQVLAEFGDREDVGSAEAIAQTLVARAAADREPARQALTAFLELAGRLELSAVPLRRAKLELDLAADEPEEAAAQARQLLEEGDAGRDALLEVVDTRRLGALLPDLPVAVADAAAEGIAGLGAAARWRDLGTACLSHLARAGRGSARWAQLATDVRDRLADDRTTGTALPTAVLTFLAGDISGSAVLFLEAQHEGAGVYDASGLVGAYVGGAHGWDESLALLGEQLWGRLAERSGRADGDYHYLQCRLALHADPPDVDRAFRHLAGLDAAGADFQASTADCLSLLNRLLRDDDGRKRLILFEARHLLTTARNPDQAARRLRELVPEYPEAQVQPRAVLGAVRAVLAECGIAHECHAPLLLVRLDVELALSAIDAASALAAVLTARGHDLAPLRARFLPLLDGAAEALPLIRRLLDVGTDEPPEEIGRAVRGAAVEERRELLALWPQSAPLRSALCGDDVPVGERAFHHAWLAVRATDPAVGADHLIRLRDLAGRDPSAAFLSGRTLLQLVERGRLPEGEVDGILSVWDAALAGAGGSTAWALLGEAAALNERRGRLDRAHYLKAQDAALKVHDGATWTDVVRLWRAARLRELRELGDPNTPDRAVRAARIHRLLMQPEAGIPLLQRQLPTAVGTGRGEILLELGRLFAAVNRHDLAAQCHEKAEPLLVGVSTETDNLFAMGVSLAYLQQFDRARQLFAEVLIRDVGHAGVRAELAKIDLPAGRLQLHQLTELAHTAWAGVRRQLATDSVADDPTGYTSFSPNRSATRASSSLSEPSRETTAS